jgi:pyruvate formate lyase activating enzyme
MTQKGMVFDIQRFSLHDGQGIRTSVFLKGCPLRCSWCHNPESWESESALFHDVVRCLKCDSCAGSAAECPSGALRNVGRLMDADEVMAEVMTDADFYEASGGGITLTGGEPAFQPGFSLELLQRAKAEGLHTTIETCGYADYEIFARMRKLTDLFLFDIKAGASDYHRLTGGSGEIVLSNLRRLLDDGAQVRLRVPLIRDVNITPGLFKTVLDFAYAKPGPLGVDLLPGHSLGKSKTTHLRRVRSR